jgi:hypothetical protein
MDNRACILYKADLITKWVVSHIALVQTTLSTPFYMMPCICHASFYFVTYGNVRCPRQTGWSIPVMPEGTVVDQPVVPGAAKHSYR